MIPGLPWAKIAVCVVILLLGIAIGTRIGIGIGVAKGTHEEQVRSKAMFDQQATDATQRLKELTDERDATKARYDAAQKQSDLDRAAATVTKDDLSRRLAAAGRLRDPGATAGSCRDSTASARPTDPGSGAGVPAATGGDISVEASDFLRKLARDADDVVTVANACKAASEVK